MSIEYNTFFLPKEFENDFNDLFIMKSYKQSIDSKINNVRGKVFNPFTNKLVSEHSFWSWILYTFTKKIMVKDPTCENIFKTMVTHLPIGFLRLNLQELMSIRMKWRYCFGDDEKIMEILLNLKFLLDEKNSSEPEDLIPIPSNEDLIKILDKTFETTGWNLILEEMGQTEAMKNGKFTQLFVVPGLEAYCRDEILEYCDYNSITLPTLFTTITNSLIRDGERVVDELENFSMFIDSAPSLFIPTFSEIPDNDFIGITNCFIISDEVINLFDEDYEVTQRVIFNRVLPPNYNDEETLTDEDDEVDIDDTEIYKESYNSCTIIKIPKGDEASFYSRVLETLVEFDIHSEEITLFSNKNLGLYKTKECSICFDSTEELVTFLPCRHKSCCYDCFKLLPDKNSCLMCRTLVKFVIIEDV